MKIEVEVKRLAPLKWQATAWTAEGSFIGLGHSRDTAIEQLKANLECYEKTTVEITPRSRRIL